MIDWLNNNQGLIGAISLIVTIIGFFIVNRNIKIKNNKKSTQKAKARGDIEQTQANNSSTINVKK